MTTFVAAQHYVINMFVGLVIYQSQKIRILSYGGLLPRVMLLTVPDDWSLDFEDYIKLIKASKILKKVPKLFFISAQKIIYQMRINLIVS